MGKKKSRPAKIDTDTCMLCLSKETNEFRLGRLMRAEDVQCHDYCLLFACGLEQNGEDDEGISGFLAPDIKKEKNRGGRLKCSFCKKPGATTACCVKSCRVMFHLPCGLRNNTLHQFMDDFKSFCEKHRPYQNSSLEVDDTCSICLTKISTRPPYIDVLVTPCCSRWFHRDCIQQQALNSGQYFFRCPLCNNENDFKKEMLTFGIHVPDQDAAWELEENAFRELSDPYSCCDAEHCLCPHGRNHDEQLTEWDIVVCQLCASQGSHVKCGNIKKNRLQSWTCATCSVIQKKRKNGSHQESPNKRLNAGESANGRNNSGSESESEEEKNSARKTLNATQITIESSDSCDVMDVKPLAVLFKKFPLSGGVSCDENLSVEGSRRITVD